MPYATDADLIAVFPTLATSAPEALRLLMLEQTQCMMSECVWGCSLMLGHVYLAAHMITMATGGPSTGGGGGQVTGKSMGPVSISYAAPASSSSDAAFGETAAGRQYLALRRMLGPMMAVPGGGCETILGGCC